MLSAIAAGTARHRRLIVCVGACVAAACPWVGLRIPRASFIGFVLGTLPVVLGLALVALAVIAMSRPRPATFAVETATSRFRTLADARQVYLAVGSTLIGTYSVAMFFGFAEWDTVGDHSESPLMTVIPVVIGGLWAVASALWVATVWRGTPDVQLRPDGMVARLLLGTLTMPWEALAPGYPRLSTDNWLMLNYARPELVRRRGWTPSRRISTGGVDPRFVGAVIAYYVAYPECRTEIGTQAGYDRLVWALTGQPPSGH